MRNNGSELRDYKDAAISQTGNTTAASLFLRYLLGAPNSEITLEELRIRFESEQWPSITKPSDRVDTAHIPHDYNLAASPLRGLLLLQRLSKLDRLSPALSRWPVAKASFAALQPSYTLSASIFLELCHVQRICHGCNVPPWRCNAKNRGMTWAIHLSGRR
jgi:hypothetical protein